MSAVEEWGAVRPEANNIMPRLAKIADAAIAELEAALAALRSRRCEGCGHVRQHAVGKPHAYRLCALGNSYGYDAALPDDFSCNCWAARALKP